MAESFLQRQQRIRAGAAGSTGGWNNPGGGYTPRPGGAPGRAPAPRPLRQPVQVQPQQGGVAPQQGGPPPQNAAQARTYTPTDFNAWAVGRYGVAPTQQDYARIQGKVGAGQGANGTYTQSQYNAGQREAENIARERGWQGAALQQEPDEAPQPAQSRAPQPGEMGHQGRVAVQPRERVQLGAYERANTGAVEPLANSLIEEILANPESLPPQVVEQMKAVAKQQGVDMASQLRGEAGAALASRGFSAGGGHQRQAQGEIDSGLVGQLLDSNRNLDITAATTNFGDRLRASQAGTDYLNSVTNRNIADNDADIRRWSAENDSDFRDEQFVYGQMQDDRAANAQEYLAREGVSLDNRKFAEQQEQFKKTFGFDLARFIEDIRRNNRDFSEGGRRYNDSSAQGWANLGQQGQQSLFNWLTSMMNGGR